MFSKLIAVSLAFTSLTAVAADEKPFSKSTDSKLMSVRKPSSTAAASCVLVVAGKTYISGDCIYDSFGGDGFQIDKKDNSYFAVLNIDSSGAHASWNGINQERHAHDELGMMKQDGNCWANENATICAIPKNASSEIKERTVCGTMKNNGDSFEILDGSIDAFASVDSEAPADPKGILKSLSSKKLNRSCVCLSGATEDFDRGGKPATSFRKLTSLRTCRVIK